MAITMTPKAVLHCVEIRKKQGIPSEHPLRIAVRMGGCAGMEYDVGFVPKASESDKCFAFSPMDMDGETLQVVVDPKSYLYINGTEVDYHASFMDSRFVFSNPNAQRSCGCGTSFTTG